MSDVEALSLEVEGSGTVSALLTLPAGAAALYVLAHGAGAGMHHSFMTAVASGVAERKIATLRYQFPSMERGSKRVDPPRAAHAAVRAAVAEAADRLPGLALFAGGKSFGGRMTSQAHAETPLPAVEGLVFLGFPLHPANEPALTRGDHLDRIACPMLFVQGTRDALADIDLIATLTRRLGDRATLVVVEDADHSFHVPARSGRSDAEVLAQALDRVAIWMAAVGADRSHSR